MPEESSREKFFELYNKLPSNLQRAISNTETGEVISDICKEYGLSEELTDATIYCATDVLLGLLPPKNFIETLKEKLKSKGDATAIQKVGKKIDEELFSKVAISLDKIYSPDWKGEISKDKQEESITEEELESEIKEKISSEEAVPQAPPEKPIVPPEAPKRPPSNFTIAPKNDLYREIPPEEEYLSKF